MAEEVLEGLDAPDAPPSQSETLMDKIIKARQEKERLQRMENQQEPGAPVLTPKAALFDMKSAKKHPANKGKHLRWINITLDEKVDARLMAGYERVPESEGGRSLGKEYALFRCPAEVAERRRKDQDERAKARLSSHNRDVERQADEIAKVLQDRYGLAVNPEDILIRER